MHVGVATEKLAELDKQMRSYVDSGKLSGIALLVVRDGKVAHVGLYGKMDLEANKPMCPLRLRRSAFIP